MSGSPVRPRWDTPYRATRLLLASTLGHLLPAIGRTAEELGLRAQVSGGLLHVVDDGDGRQVSRLFHRLAHELTGAETEAVRVATDPPSDGPELAARLLTAPTLAVELARRGVTVEIGLLADAELWPVYQPIVSLSTGAVVAHEALLRGLVDGQEVGGGDLFFLAEAAGWLPQLDRVAREGAIAGAASWLGSADLYVNFSPAAVHRPEVDLAGTERLAQRGGLAPGQLVFEVVAEHALADRGHLLAVLEHHRSLGWRVALDDVGIGWSSLTLVTSVRPDVVKLGRELVTRLSEPGPNAVARALAESAHALGAVVVAEGVEDEPMADQARAVGADLGQGWWFGRPSKPQREEAAGPEPAPEPEPEPELVRTA